MEVEGLSVKNCKFKPISA